MRAGRWLPEEDGMFTIIISEKGGAERREAFDRNEINVGRVQGNDLMLPKGNVSKHHARLLFRDGRFIVTDLKSTNGTYVNGRKISQATIVREGDKIYIGDFVLRLETGQSGALADAGGVDDSLVRASSPRASSVARDASSDAPPDAPTGAPPPLAPMMGGAGSISAAPLAPGHRHAESPSAGQNVSHFPLERDPDSESAPELFSAALSPRVPGPPRLPQADAKPRATTAMLGAAVPPPPARSPSRPTPQQTARRHALVALVDRVAAALDLSALDQSPAVDAALAQRIEAIAQEQARAMRQEGEAPESVDLEQLAGDAQRELVGLGPLGPLLDGDEADEVHVPRPDAVLAVRDGHTSLIEPAFTSEEALRRVVARLAQQAGEPVRPGEALVERRLPGGVRMTAIAPPLATGWTVTLQKRVHADGSLEEHVRTGVLSRSMAVLLEACVAAHANILVVGSGTGVASQVVAALAFASAVGERIVYLTDADDIRVAHAYVTRVGLPGGAGAEETVRTVARLRPDRLVVARLTGAVAAATVEAVGEGTAGVVAGMSAPSLRHALSRLAGQVGLARSGVSVDAARDAVAGSFDVGVEVSRATDGRVRIVRLAEITGTDADGISFRDLFVASADGTGDAGYVATGATPRFLNDFASRGIRLDAALFKRR
jgi:pilus assembly protein CpaF